MIPEVPHSPTSDDVAKARNLLFGNALIDFPFVDDFDGSSPEAGGRGSRANAVATTATRLIFAVLHIAPRPRKLPLGPKR